MMRWTLALTAAIAMPVAAHAKVTPAQCAAAIAYSDAHQGRAIFVLDSGKPVCERYTSSDVATANELWSGTKSFVGIMAAAAVQDKLLTLDEHAAATITEWMSDPRKSPITLRQLLSMASGQAGTIGRPPTYADAIAAPLSADPGTKFQYGPTPMQIFGEIMRRKLAAKGMDPNPLAYLKRRVLNPIDMTIGSWRSGPDGNPLMPQGAVLTARDWAKVGEFVRAGGKAGGKQIVDPATLAALFEPSALNPTYGLTWWLPHPSASPDPVTASTDIGRRAAELPKDLVVAAGAGDQRLYVIRSLGLTIVRQAKLDIVAAMRGEKSGWSDADFLERLLGPGSR
jgi:CubicO group peptidase (beta-lactamase class C family)